MASAGDKLRGIGYLAMSLGFGISALSILRGEGDPSDDLQAEKKKQRGLGLLPPPKVTTHDVSNITERVKLLNKMMKKGHFNPKVVEATRQIVSMKCSDPQGGQRYCVPEKDCWAEVAWIFNAIRNPNSKYSVRYTRDQLLADTFSAAERTLFETHAEDCDGFSITIGAMLMAIGHQVRTRVIGTTGAPDQDFSHVYLITPTKFDDPDAPWAAVDCSVQKMVGWEAPGASRVAATGKPSGVVTRVKDYDAATGSEVPPVATKDMTSWHP